ncbi:MAG: signal recognition particle-docking protein FtsY [Candidatus Micrarchaeaceae archaeon]
MFENLRKKFSDFANGLVKKELLEERAEEHGSETSKGNKAQEKRADISLRTKVGGAIFGNVKLTESDIAPFAEELKMSLIKSDVNYDVAEKLSDSIEKRLIKKEVNAKDAKKAINDEIRSVVAETLAKNKGTDILEGIRNAKSAGKVPYVILFLGPNGAGKTTTIAKLAAMLTKNGVSCAIAAGDTFRAAAIEQISMHANKLGVEVIKGAYGADPASVAFDAIAHAKSRSIDCVLIDTAGRQETNKSLIEELRKIARVSKPDLVIFVGESVAGNALLDQVKEFGQAVKLDGIILTKLDCDAKGGNTLSILSETAVPVLYLGTGEAYSELVQYSPEIILSNILPENKEPT